MHSECDAIFSTLCLYRKQYNNKLEIFVIIEIKTQLSIEPIELCFWAHRENEFYLSKEITLNIYYLGEITKHVTRLCKKYFFLSI